MEGTKNGGRAERRPALGEALVSLCAAGQGASCRRELLISPNMQHGSILPITEAERLIACLKLPSPSCSPHSYHLLFLSLSLFLSFPLLPSFLFLSLKKKNIPDTNLEKQKHEIPMDSRWVRAWPEVQQSGQRDVMNRKQTLIGGSRSLWFVNFFRREYEESPVMEVPHVSTLVGEKCLAWDRKYHHFFILIGKISLRFQYVFSLLFTTSANLLAKLLKSLILLGMRWAVGVLPGLLVDAECQLAATSNTT